jgi:hypothetical protein
MPDAAIHELLERTARHLGVRILDACESGSRAWGFASPDSDFDIRFILARPPESYLGVAERSESIELPLEGRLDASGWDVRKAARLLGKSNGALVCCSVPRDAKPIGWLHCNHDAFRAHCKAHREYWVWVGIRNAERYQTNSEHGRGYDSKNLMHTLRLLEMAAEIATEGTLRLRRANREWLLRVRAGESDYETLPRSGWAKCAPPSHAPPSRRSPTAPAPPSRCWRSAPASRNSGPSRGVSPR